MGAQFFDNTVIGSAGKAPDFIGNFFEYSIEYPVIGKDLDGMILLWNEDARCPYGCEPEEVVVRANAVILLTEEDVAAGKWEGAIQRSPPGCVRGGRVNDDS